MIYKSKLTIVTIRKFTLSMIILKGKTNICHVKKNSVKISQVTDTEKVKAVYLNLYFVLKYIYKPICVFVLGNSCKLLLI